MIMEVATGSAAGKTGSVSLPQSAYHTVTGVTPSAIVFPLMLIGAYGLNCPWLLKMYMKVMVAGLAPSATVKVFPVMLMSPIALGYPCAVLPDSAFMKIDPSVASIVLSAMTYPFAAF